MKVTLTKNLGSRDAAQVDKKQDDCREGCTVQMEDDAAEWLIKKGFATPAEGKEPKPEPIEAVPEKSVAAKPEATTKGVGQTPKKKN